MSSLILGMRLSLYDFQRVKIDDVDFSTKIENFKDDVSRKANLPKENLELVYCGNILDDESTLKSSGLKPGVMVHVLKKKAKEIPRPIPTMTQKDIDALVMAFHALKLNSNYRNSLQKLSRPDILDNIIMITPGLSQDPVAISLIQDPELLVRLGDVDTVKRGMVHHEFLPQGRTVNKEYYLQVMRNLREAICQKRPDLWKNKNWLLHHDKAPAHTSLLVRDILAKNNTLIIILDHHPALAEAANHIAAAVHEDAVGSTNTQPSTSSGYSYSLEALSEDDEMDSSQSSDSQPFRQHVTEITASQLAAAIASATNSASSSSLETGGITSEMFSQAMQRAIANVNPSSSAETSPIFIAPPSETESENSGQRLAQQVQQMRELGLTNDALNIQALTLAGGNVYAAIDLVFSGAIGPNP